MYLNKRLHSLSINKQKQFHNINNTVIKKMFVGFNQDYSCLACGTSTGFEVWNVNPFEKRINRSELGHSIKIVRPLYKTNIFALVGNDPESNEWSDHNLIIWDDSKNTVITNVRFRKTIIAIQITMTMLIIAFHDSVNVYYTNTNTNNDNNDNSFEEMLSHPHTSMTYDNTPWTTSISPNDKNPIVVFPAITMGYVNISDRGVMTNRIIRAHKSEIIAVAINTLGTSIATASCKGTVIRLWDTETGALQFEFRRGSNPTTITCLNYSSDGRWLFAGSGRGTIHIFDIRQPRITATTHIESLIELIPLWSFAQCRFPATESNVCAGMDNKYNVYVATSDGDYYSFRIDPIHGGNAKRYCDNKIM